MDRANSKEISEEIMNTALCDKVCNLTFWCDHVIINFDGNKLLYLIKNNFEDLLEVILYPFLLLDKPLIKNLNNKYQYCYVIVLVYGNYVYSFYQNFADNVTSSFIQNLFQFEIKIIGKFAINIRRF